MKVLFASLLLFFTALSARAQSNFGVRLAGAKPELVVDGKRTVPPLSINDLLKTPLFVYSKDVLKVTEFHFTIKPGRHDILGPFTVHGSELTAELRDILQKCAAEPGEVYFDEIKCLGTDKLLRSLNSIHVKYKN